MDILKQYDEYYVVEDGNSLKVFTERKVTALVKFEELVERQGGDITYISNPEKFEKAKYIIPVAADERGALKTIKTEMIGNISVYVGAGRMKKEDEIDYAAGIEMNQKIGNVVEVGDVLAYIHTNDESKIDGAVRNLKEAFELDPKKVAKTNAVAYTAYLLSALGIAILGYVGMKVKDNMQEYRYEFDKVTDEDVSIPDLTNYTVENKVLNFNLKYKNSNI